MARRRQRVRLQDGLRLDLNSLVRQELVHPGSKRNGTIRWAYCNSNNEIASGRITADTTDERRGWLRLELGELDQRIELVALARHYGGRQWYLPLSADRAASVGAVEAARGAIFRVPSGLGPASRLRVPVSIPVSSRLIGGTGHPMSAWGGIIPLVGDELPPRPKGMHRRTYEKIMKRYEAYKTTMDQDLILALARLMR